MFNSNIGHNMAPLQVISLKNLSDLDFDLSRSLKVSPNGAAGLPIYDFLLVSNSNLMSLSPFRSPSYLKKNFLSRNIMAKFRPQPTHLYPGAIFFFKIEWFPPWVRGKPSTKNEVDHFNIFRVILHTNRHTQIQSKKPHHASMGRV